VQPLRFERFIVQPGDTLFDISAVYGVSIDDLLRFNPNLGNGARIDIGQLVRIPVFAE
jgi:LysM repeat protein